ncbi:MAG TPA: amidohydrolase family protein [Gemmatimonadota bacterium]|nr:amidohydrolase family protein [Gemmatimonadota bacterium]
MRVTTLLLVVTTLSGAQAPDAGEETGPARPSAMLAIVGGTVFPQPYAQPIEDGAVLVVDGRIAAVGPRSEVEIPADAEIVDAAGGSVLPGFWNLHVHFTEPVFAGADTVSAEILAEALREMLLQHGFVHVLDTGSFLDNTLALGARVESGEVPGPEIWTTGAPFTAPGGTPIYVRPIELPALATPEVARDSVRMRLDRGADAIKLFTGSPVDWESPPVLMDEAVVAEAAESAHAAGALVLAHPTSVAGIRVAAWNGVDLILHTTPDDTTAWDPDLIREMLDRHVHLAPTLKLWAWELERAGRPPEAVHAFQQAGVRQLADFFRAGGRVVFGTDVGYMADHDPADELRLMAEAGLEFHAILETLTTRPAALLGREFRSGRIVVGKAGDLVVVHGRPDQAIEALGEVRLTVREGRVVYRSLNFSPNG